MSDLSHYIDAFAHLNTAKIKGHKAPHKAVLLLAVIDLVEEGLITSPHIVLSDPLVDAFNRVWRHYLGTSAIFNPDIAKPFFHMQHESFWRLVDHDESLSALAAEEGFWLSSKWVAATDTLVKKSLPQGGYSIAAMRSAFAYALIDQRLFALFQNADARAMLRVFLIDVYLTHQPTKSMPNLSHLLGVLPFISFVA